MQWSREDAFTTGSPWLPYGDLTVTVEQQRDDPASMLSLYRRLIWFRRSSSALRFGAYQPIDGLPAGVYAYTRIHGDERLLTALNFTNDPIGFDLPESLSVAESIAGTHAPESAARSITLQGNEGQLLRLAPLG